MRIDRARTISALRRLAERPGTPAEGDAAKRMLEKLGASQFIPRPFDRALYPVGARIFYCYWCYRNEPGVVASSRVKVVRGADWMRIKFDHLKTPRWVPVVSHLGCHIGTEPFIGSDQETLYRMDEDWFIHDTEFADKLLKLGIDVGNFRKVEHSGVAALGEKIHPCA